MGSPIPYRTLGYAIKVLIIIITLIVVFYKVTNNEDIHEIGDYFDRISNETGNYWKLILAILLMPINWGIESLKWKVLVDRIERISITKSFLAVLSGVTVSVFTPNRIGEYAGRVLFVKHENRIIVALTTLISSISQVLTTIILGSWAFVQFLKITGEVSEKSWFISYISFFVLLLTASLLLLFLNTPSLILLANKLRINQRIKKYISVFDRYSIIELSKVLLMSITRYFIFTTQLMLLLSFFKVEYRISEMIVMIAMTFLSLAIIPTIALAELGIREVVALNFIGLLSSNQIGIVSSTFFLWSINLAIPAILGSIVALRTRIFKS